MREEPLFRKALERCDRIVGRFAPWSLIEELTSDQGRFRVSDTRIVQVANCALQIALAALWRSWGIVSDAVIGHSAGEMGAAHVAGALSLEDALVVAFHRGRLLHLEPGPERCWPQPFRRTRLKESSLDTEGAWRSAQ